MSVQILTQKLCIKCLSLGKMSTKIIHRTRNACIWGNSIQGIIYRHTDRETHVHTKRHIVGKLINGQWQIWGEV